MTKTLTVKRVDGRKPTVTIDHIGENIMFFTADDLDLLAATYSRIARDLKYNLLCNNETKEYAL